MSTARRYKVGINTNIIGKPARDKGVNQASDWRCLELTETEFVGHIEVGHAFSAHYRDGYRKTTNFICSEVVAADVDGAFTIEEALEQPFINDFASFIYTTPSHSEDRHRFRIVFLLEETITKAADWANCLYGLALKLGSDPSIKDSGRLFYGNPKAMVAHIGNRLPYDEAAKLIEIGQQQRAIRKSPDRSDAPTVSPHVLTPDSPVRMASGEVIAFRDLPYKASVYCPFHLDTRPSAFVVKSHRKTHGIHCMACNATFWADRLEEYDFDAFDRLLEERAEIDRDRLEDHLGSDDFFEQFFPPAPSVTTYQERYLPALDYRPGITLVKSPKGSGKTEALRALISKVKARVFPIDVPKKDQPRSILLVGHRQSLIKEAAKKLGLNCYIDNGEPPIDFNGYATSLDSLYKVMDHIGFRRHELPHGGSKPMTYDLLILDESEQVFTHLTADTLAKNRGTLRAYNALQKAVRQAKAVYALDADLGFISAHGIRAFRPDDWRHHTRIIFNKPLEVEKRRTLRLYRARKDLEARVVDAIKGGERCFIVSNSKKAVDTLEQLIRDQCGKAVSLRKITSENSRSPQERDFVGSITSEFLKIQVLLCSPSLGTGIDISFPDGSQEVDHVFGFFYPFINTHTDIDQQLARVRNPKAVSVWFDPTRYSYETSFEVIRDDLARGHWVESAIVGYDNDGRLQYDKDHPLLLIMSHIVCARRASQNRIVELFVRLRNANGWDVEFVAKQNGKTAKQKKASDWLKASDRVKAGYLKGILEAEDVPDEDVIDLYEAQRRGEALSERERFQLERGMLRMSFNRPVTADLIEQASDGKLRDRVRYFRAMMDREMPLMMSPIVERMRRGGRPEKISKMPAALLLYVVGTIAGIVDDKGALVVTPLKKDDFAAFVAFCRTNRTAIEEILKLPLRDDLEKNPVRQLNQFLKLVGLSVKPNARRRHKGAAKFDYVVDMKAAALMKELAADFTEFESVARSPG